MSDSVAIEHEILSGPTWVLSNGTLVARIDAMGAQLRALDFMADESQHLWPGHVDSWPASSPILFPIVGGLNAGAYYHQGCRYELPVHGFANRQLFTLVSVEADRVHLELTSNPETFLQYPFLFRLEVVYSLRGNTLCIDFTVTNSGQVVLPFSLGAHPGLRCPVSEGTRFEDYYLEFEHEEQTLRWMKAGQVLSGEVRDFVTHNKKVYLTRTLFAEGPVILKAVKSRHLTLSSRLTRRKISVFFPDFEQLGLWVSPSKPNDFICIEPWVGVDSTLGAVDELTQKEAIQLLDPGHSRSFQYSIAIR